MSVKEKGNYLRTTIEDVAPCDKCEESRRCTVVYYAWSRQKIRLCLQCLKQLLGEHLARYAADAC